VFIANTDVEGMVAGCTGPADILKIAIGFEKDSVVLYTSMKDVVPERLGKPTIDRLIAEEVTHVVMLQRKLDALG
jgi:rubrerythrin